VTSSPKSSLLSLVATLAIGALAGAILGKVASAIIGYFLYFVMLLSVINRPVGADSWFAAMAALPIVGWSFGAFPGAVSGAVTFATRRLAAVLAGGLAALAYALVVAQRGSPVLAALIALITSLGALSAGLSLYLVLWLLTPRVGRTPKAA
jgi:hypothetical protein